MTYAPLTQARFGQVAAAPAPATAPGDGGGDQSFDVAGFTAALKQVTPALFLVGIFTGAAFAIGSALASRYVVPTKWGRR